MGEMAQYPMAIAALLYVLKMMLDYIKELKREKRDVVKEPYINDSLSDNFKSEFYDMTRQVKDIHTWLEKEDNDGKKLIYIPSTFEQTINNFSALLKENTGVLRGLKETIERIEQS